ncbi:MAG: hypothetical protein K2P14_03450 [Anaeroplasmataceae bacterium]|nr:hypothetical protein [Anaeroplasmataceae bacterium]
MITNNGQIFATSDMGVVDTAARTGYKLIYIGDQLEMPQGYKFVNAIMLTPDYKTMSAIIEGNQERVAQNYYASLQTPQAEELFAIIIGALRSNSQIMMYFPNETLQLKYPYLLLEHMLNKYGIRVGDSGNPFVYNPAYDASNFRLLYLYNLVTWQEFILNTEDLDDFTIAKLKQELCQQFNIPANISNIDMVNEIQKIKDKLINDMKPQLFTVIEEE